MKKIKLIIASIIAGILYRMGGTSLGTKWRDFGVPIISAIAMMFMGYSLSWQLVLSTILLFASLTTYWKKISKWIGKDTEDVYWWNWLVTGIAYGLAYSPMYFSGISIGLILIRSLVLGILVTVWSELINNATLEEFGRGALIVLTILIYGGGTMTTALVSIALLALVVYAIIRSK